jgi:hypothetical protein
LHWTSTRISFCSRSIVSAFVIYKIHHNEHKVNLKDERSKALITDYVMIMDEALASFCGNNAATEERLSTDAYHFCRVIGHYSVDASHPMHNFITFNRRSSRLNETEMLRFVYQSIANRRVDTVLGLVLWPIRNASSMV